MTTPIRPPGQANSLPEPSELEGVDATTSGHESLVDSEVPVESEAPVESKSPVEGVSQVGETTGASAAQPIEGIEQIAASLRSGAIDVSAAVEQVLQRAMGQELVAGLDPSQRETLERTLRQALADDPTLSALIGDLRRS